MRSIEDRNGQTLHLRGEQRDIHILKCKLGVLDMTSLGREVTRFTRTLRDQRSPLSLPVGKRETICFGSLQFLHQVCL